MKHHEALIETLSYTVKLYMLYYIYTHTVLYYLVIIFAVVFLVVLWMWSFVLLLGASRSSTLEKQRLFYEEHVKTCRSIMETTSHHVKDHFQSVKLSLTKQASDIRHQTSDQAASLCQVGHPAVDGGN